MGSNGLDAMYATCSPFNFPYANGPVISIVMSLFNASFFTEVILLRNEHSNRISPHSEYTSEAALMPNLAHQSHPPPRGYLQ